MLRNYIKIAFRNILRNRTYSFINIFGLAIGITCSSLLFLLVGHELSFDKQHAKGNRMYRIVEKSTAAGEERFFGVTAPVLAPTLASDYTQVKEFTRLFKFGGHINFMDRDTKVGERNYYFADSSFFDVFDYELISGDRRTVLDNPFSIVLDEDWAQKLFGDRDPIGREIMVIEYGNCIVTGVMKNFPDNSHIQAKILVSLPYNEDFFKDYASNWNANGAYSYVVLNSPQDGDKISAEIPSFLTKYYGENARRDFYLQPLHDIHFNSKSIESAIEPSKGQSEYLIVFIAIALFMLLIASINYINLATAKSLHRAKEIGMRKVSGALRYQLIGQFLSESAIIALLSFAVSIVLVDAVIPYFNYLSGYEFSLEGPGFKRIMLVLLVVTLAVGLLSGIYPALVMSKVSPVRMLKGGSTSSGLGSVLLRKALVIVQFSLSIIMIIATIVVSGQMDFIRNANLGFDNQNIMVVDINNGEVRQRYDVMKNELEKSPYIHEVAVSSRVPGEWKNLAQVYIKDFQNTSDSVRFNYIGIDEDMLSVYNIKLLKGENFAGTAAEDSLHILINQAAAKVIDYEDPVGRLLNIEGVEYKIMGVVSDFNFESLHHDISPLILGFRANSIQAIDYFSLKYDAQHTQEALVHATKVHDSFDSTTPIEYHFLNEQWNAFYKNDTQVGNIFKISAGLTLFVACLGLFGLASFIIQKRTKEIGVRKVLGASVFNLFLLLFRAFASQVMIAYLLAVPVAWFIMDQWLGNFAVRFDWGLPEFIKAGIIALLVALLSVGYRVIKAARLDPAHTLRSE